MLYHLRLHAEVTDGRHLPGRIDREDCAKKSGEILILRAGQYVLSESENEAPKPQSMILVFSLRSRSYVGAGFSATAMTFVTCTFELGFTTWFETFLRFLIFHASSTKAGHHEWPSSYAGALAGGQDSGRTSILLQHTDKGNTMEQAC
jgi:hypothetical protein